MSEHLDPISFAFSRGFGRWLISLRGKIPVLDAWPSLPPVTEEQVREWHEIGFNLGLRTGHRSKLFVIDDDQERGGVHESDRYVPPPTDLVSASPTGGRHYYYVAPDACPGNSASRLAPHVDTRGEGGQIVYVGSIHPKLKRPYRWISTGEPSELPPETLDALRGPRVDMTAPAPVSGVGYAQTALVREVARVRAAPEGTRNAQLNRAAFSLGQLVAGGALAAADVTAELGAAAKIAGLPEREAASTIQSGLAGGAKRPRAGPERLTAARSATATVPPPAVTTLPDVLVPGSHTMPSGEYREQGTAAFARDVLHGLPGGAIYRRAGVVGEIHTDTGTFRRVSSERTRSVVDQCVRLAAGKAAKDNGEPTIVFRSCSSDLARVLLAYAETQGDVRELKHLATHPVCIGEDFRTARPGWNATAGVYLTDCDVPEPLDLPTARAVLEDLVCDFPFRAPADRANFFGLLLTPILRPALDEPVPMHLIGSPIERTGKTKLAETVLGCAVLGHPTPALQIGCSEDEREKRILSLLLSGATVAHLDNLREFVDSPALASLLTSSSYQGRVLGASTLVTAPNGLTLVASGNNVHASGELAKRVVPIILQPDTEAPEMRQDYRHPLLRSYVEAERPRVLGALLGLVSTWQEAGRPLGSVGFGGFERWSTVLGGIMHTAGYPEWLGNLADWRGGADDFGEELAGFVSSWHVKYACEWVATADLYDLADQGGYFARQTNQSTERGRRTAFGQRVLSVACDRMIGNLRVEIAGRGSHRRGRLTLGGNLDRLGEPEIAGSPGGSPAVSLYPNII